MTELDDDILTLFFDSALAATAPVFLTATGLYEGACESGTVTSHTSDLPWAHGIDVSSSGLLPSDLDNPDGSRVDGIPAEAIALYKTLLTVACRWCFPLFLLQESPWCARISTLTPHCRHTCGVQIGKPKRRATAILTVSSSTLRPSAEIGRAWSEAPASGANTAISLPQEISSGAFESNKS